MTNSKRWDIAMNSIFRQVVDKYPNRNLFIKIRPIDINMESGSPGSYKVRIGMEETEHRFSARAYVLNMEDSGYIELPEDIQEYMFITVSYDVIYNWVSEV